MKLLKKHAIFFFSFLAITFILTTAFSYENVLDDLKSSKIGSFPKRWRTWPFQRDDAATVYRVAEEGGARYIKAFDDHDASKQIFLNFNWQIENAPVLSWRWRALTLPEGAKESDDNLNDSACGVYVVVGKYDGHAMKYVWSSSLPAGTVVSRREGKLKIKVLDSGMKNKGKWVAHKTNVVEDYKALFGGDLKKNPSGIALLTDGNAVHKPAGCDYADFKIESAK